MSIKPDDVLSADLYEKAVGCPAGFAEVSSRGKWIRARHLDRINQELRTLTEPTGRRLAVFVPPRHGKSELLSKYLPAWYLGILPTHRVILTSYEADFAASWSAKARDLLVEHGPRIFGVRVKNGYQAPKSGWVVQDPNETEEGCCYSAGVGGPITGKGANLAIIDDPVKNAEQAYSATYRQKAWDWYQSTLYTRLEPGAHIVLIMTRWHEDDLAGRILNERKAA